MSSTKIVKVVARIWAHCSDCAYREAQKLYPFMNIDYSGIEAYYDKSYLITLTPKEKETRLVVIDA